MKNAIDIIGTNVAIVIYGELSKNQFDDICKNIENVPIWDKMHYLINFLESNDIEVIDIVTNRKLFGCVARYMF